MNVRVEILKRMKLIRCVEEAIADNYSDQKMRCPTHLSIGQEAVGATAGVILSPSDQAVSTHRAHAHYLGKGGNVRAMIAEIYGKATGCSSGKGGSMHLIDLAVGFMGSTSIVGNSIPIGVGAALTNKLTQNNAISCVFLGDAAVEEGVFTESINFSVIKKLPVLFLCEHKLYSVYSPLAVRQPADREIWKLVAAHGVSAAHVNGYDVEATLRAVKNAVDHVRSGHGPYFLEAATYRWREHCGPNYDNDIGYRTEEEFLKWQENDPIPAYQSKLLACGEVDEAGLGAMDSEIGEVILDAFRFAKDSPFPDESQLHKDLFVQGCS